MTNIAILKNSSPFYPLFPEGVPIKNILFPTLVVCGTEETTAYMVDLDKIGGEKFLELAKLIVAQCDPNQPILQAMAEMRERGLPLRAKHVASVSSDSRAFL